MTCVSIRKSKKEKFQEKKHNGRKLPDNAIKVALWLHDRHIISSITKEN